MALTKCKECGKEVSRKAKACPHCGARLGAKPHGCGALILLALLVFVLIGIFSSDNTQDRGSEDMTESMASRSSSTNSSSPISSTPLEVLSFQCKREYSYISVSGEVRNISDRNMENVMAVGVFRQNDGSLVKSKDSLIDYNPILSGQVSPFEVSVTDNPEIASCNINFKYLFGGTIEFTTRAKRIEEAQKLLSELGYDPGGIDGIIGPKTRAAIWAFQQRRGLPKTDAVDNYLLRELRSAERR